MTPYEAAAQLAAIGTELATLRPTLRDVLRQIDGALRDLEAIGCEVGTPEFECAWFLDQARDQISAQAQDKPADETVPSFLRRQCE